MQHIRLIFDKNIHTCEKGAIEISKISSLTYYHFSFEIFNLPALKVQNAHKSLFPEQQEKICNFFTLLIF